MKIELALIVAMADNHVIGNDNQLPWHLPEDLKHFKAVTLGKPIIMGRKTWESLGRALPGRLNIVITRNDAYQADGATVVDSLETAIEVGKYQAQQDGVDEVMIIGGANIYEQSLALVDRLYITQVHLEPEGDAYFPEFDAGNLSIITEEKFTSAKAIDYSIRVYERSKDNSQESSQKSRQGEHNG